MRLAAANQSGRIHIVVNDDGRGIDIERIVAAAAEHGIAGTELSVDQCLRLIFRPGFSTSNELIRTLGPGHRFGHSRSRDGHRRRRSSSGN